jgi:hypothetical protein
MSAIITGRLFWTDFTDLSYKNKKGKDVTVKETTAKIVMLSIGDSADDYGENSWQSFETIAKKSSLQRRSVIRVIRALMEHGYLRIAGTTKYGTNNFTVCMEKLGEPPKKRARTGRPKTSDSETDIGDSESKSGDSETETGDGESPYPSSIRTDPSSNNGSDENPEPYDRAKGIEEAKKRKAKADALRESTDILVEWGKLSSDKEQRYNEMEDRIYKSTGLTVSDRWYRERVMDFLLEKDEQGETIETFAKACKDDPYNMPKFFQIAQKLSLLKDTWGLAFVDDSEQGNNNSGEDLYPTL